MKPANWLFEEEEDEWGETEEIKFIRIRCQSGNNKRAKEDRLRRINSSSHK